MLTYYIFRGGVVCCLLFVVWCIILFGKMFQFYVALICFALLCFALLRKKVLVHIHIHMHMHMRACLTLGMWCVVCGVCGVCCALFSVICFSHCHLRRTLPTIYLWLAGSQFVFRVHLTALPAH